MMPAAEDSTMCNEELLASSMAQSLRIPHAVARFLVARGVRTLTEAHRMLCGNADGVHDPFLMKGMEEAVAWLLDVRERGEKVFVFGDYDLDGMTAVTLMTRALAELGIESDWRLPNRFGDGYGLSVSAVVMSSRSIRVSRRTQKLPWPKSWACRCWSLTTISPLAKDFPNAMSCWTRIRKVILIRIRNFAESEFRINSFVLFILGSACLNLRNSLTWWL